MAVKAPTAPVPPTPPTVPGVTLKEGGTAQETNVPRDKHQTGEEQREDQARQSVAQGNGALSKTTQSKPEKQSQKPVDASGGASQENQRTNTVVIPAQNGLGQENPQQQALEDAKAANSQTQMAAQQDNGWSQFSSHGAMFWGAVLVAMAIVVWFGIRKLMARKDGKKGALSFADIDGAAAPVPLPGQGKKSPLMDKAPRSREQVENFTELRGLTPDEVLTKIAREEEEALRREMRQARAEAKERLQKAGRIPVNTSPPTQAARQYREQVTAELPREKAKPKPPVKKRPALPEEEQRFEVRI